MRLNDGKPWFRKWMGFGRWPIALEGALLVIFTLGFCVAAVVIAFQLPAASPWREVLHWLAFLVGIGANAVIFWKTEDAY